MNTKNLIILSIFAAFGAGLLSLFDGFLVQHYVHLSCALAWGLGLIALAIIDKK